MDGGDSGSCWHCGGLLPAGDAPSARVGGQPRRFCCPGCRAVAQWIEQLGLGDYYRVRSAAAVRPEGGGGDAAVWQGAELAEHVVRRLADGQCETLLFIDGIRCSACVWLIERLLGAAPGVVGVQVNAAAQRARITWQPERCGLPAILDALQRCGYRGRPLALAALDDARRRESRQALKRLVVAGFGAMQAMMYASALYLGALDDIDRSTRELMRWLGLLVTTPVVFYAAAPFFSGAVRALRARRLSMDVPVALAIALIFAASLLGALRGAGEVYFDSVGMFVFFLLVGRYLEMRARHRAADLGDAHARLMPTLADRLRADGTLERVAAHMLAPGDLVHVAEGATVPADGVLEGPGCRVDEALLSGESAAVAKTAGSALIAGSLVAQGPARLRVLKVGADTALAGIVALVSRAQTERPRLALAGERAAAGFVVRVLALAALTALGWGLIDPPRAFDAALAVLVVSCPCALALAVPAALTRAMAVLAGRGVLVVRPDAIEALAGATHAVFDKTGTLTLPQLALERVELMGVTGAASRDEALAAAAALASGSRHPASRALVDAAGAGAAMADDPREVAGRGVEGRVGGRRLRLGSAAFALDGAAGDAGGGVVLADVDTNTPIAVFHLSERLRADAGETIAALRHAGLAIEIASGDAPARVGRIAARLGISTWQARQRPADKLAHLAALRAQGARAMAVGDGINDAPALAGADVSVALAAGADLAQATSDIVLRGEGLLGIAQARQVAAQTMRILRQNQRWALGYNLAAVPFAALGAVPPWLAAIGMSASSLVVVLNALRIGGDLAVQRPARRFAREAVA